MAKPLTYRPTPVSTDTAQDELNRLLETFHERGVLRLLTNLSAQSHDVAEVALKQLDTPGGKKLIDNLVILLKTLSELDSGALSSLLLGVDKGVKAAVETLEERDKPKNAFALLGKLNDPDTRRGLNALLTLVQTLGHHLGENEQKRGT